MCSLAASQIRKLAATYLEDTCEAFCLHSTGEKWPAVLLAKRSPPCWIGWRWWFLQVIETWTELYKIFFRLIILMLKSRNRCLIWCCSVCYVSLKWRIISIIKFECWRWTVLVKSHLWQQWNDEICTNFFNDLKLLLQHLGFFLSICLSYLLGPMLALLLTDHSS